MARRTSGIPSSVIALIATLLVAGLTAAKIGISESSTVIFAALGLGGFAVHRVMSDRENGKVLFSFAGENAAGSDKWPGRKLERTGVELNRREAFGYAF